MIVLDRQSAEDGAYIGIQRPDKAYTYLHWEFEDKIKSNKHHFTKFSTFLENYSEIYAIGPNTLVVWSSEDEAGLC